MVRSAPRVQPRQRSLEAAARARHRELRNLLTERANGTFRLARDAESQKTSFQLVVLMLLSLLPWESAESTV